MTILGISCFYHDGAAALVIDGKIIAAAEEEKFSRIKHDSGFPKYAIDFCLRQGKIKPKDIDAVIFYEKPFLKFERILLTSLSTAPSGRGLFVDAMKTWLKDKLWIKAKIASKLKIPSKKILFSQHHLSHAASAYFAAPFNSAAILTADGVGEWTTTAWGKAKNNKLFLTEEIKFPHSLGLFYSVFTQFLGFQINEGEYKVMGLAPYGKPRFLKKISKLIKQSPDGSYKMDLDYFNFYLSEKTSYSKKLIDLLKVPPVDPKESDKVLPVYADIASSAQKVLEEKLLTIAKKIKKETGEENLCFAGGVALNGVANWRLFKEAGFKNIFVQPAAGDSGGALGAALYLYHHILGNRKRNNFNSIFLGEKNKEKDILKFVKKNKLKYKKYSDKALIEQIVGYLTDKRVIGFVRGRFEWGPRALGARSILADPRDKKMKDIVNSKIKFREGFRPFAPVTLYELGSEYFELDGVIPPLLEYMLAVVPVRRKWRSKLGAINHVDNTARPQLIKREKNPIYYDVVKEFGKRTGVSVLLNTSFNLKGEPIVNTFEEAYSTFMKSGLDYLVLENYIIEK